MFQDLNKNQLRSACRENGIRNYGKMTTAQMREALTAIQKPAKVYSEDDLAAMGREGADGKCPHCGINHLENGYLDTVTALDLADGDPNLAIKAQTHEFSCSGCIGEWGKPVSLQTYRDLATKHTAPKTKGISIQKDREERNGIKRPSHGGACAAVWDYCDEFVAANDGKLPMPKDMKAWAASTGHNANNVVIEMYQWRKFIK